MEACVTKNAEQLALLGGKKTISYDIRHTNSIGFEEADAVKKVIESGVLSQFLGAWHEDFYGGPKVLEFEKAWKAYFNVAHAITVNSATSGLIAVLGAIGIEPGDEVIVSPWTMCASATAILHWNAIPVFADIESKTFCIDPSSVEKNITPYTKAIIAVDIFGHSANMEALRDLARKNDLKLISDTAQAPGAKYHAKYAGTLADVAIYSLNYHKHIHTGEGGVVITNDSIIAERLRLIRNHAEAVVGHKGETNLSNMIGYNFRLGEIEAAIGIEQLKKLDRLTESRRKLAKQLTQGLKNLVGLQLPYEENDCSHVYYMYPMVLNVDLLSVTRQQIYDALIAEGIPGLASGYQNIHLLPMYQKKIAYGSTGFPWNAEFCKREVSYQKGICPVAETLHDNSYLGLALCAYDFSEPDIDLIVKAFHKVWKQLVKKY